MNLLAAVLMAGLQCPDGTPPPCTRPAAPARAPSSNSIAVLYFDNLSRDSADAYIADGLTDEIIVRLQQVQRLDVKSRNEVRRFRGSRSVDARTMGRELRVAYLVTGSVRPSPSRLRVTYELVRTSDGRSLAANIVDTTSADQWAISNNVAVAIARQVAGQLAPDERAALARGPTRDAQALDLYRRGMYLMDRGIATDPVEIISATGFFQAAIERDSSFAQAWAAMADAWLWTGDQLIPNRMAMARARQAALRALALDSSQARAYVALATAHYSIDFNWPEAERLLRIAVAREPGSVPAHGALATVLAATGRGDEAWQSFLALWQADSLDRRVTWYLTSTAMSTGRQAELERWASRIGPEQAANLRFHARLGTGVPLDSSIYAGRAPAWLRVLARVSEGRLDEARAEAARRQAIDDTVHLRGQWPAPLFPDLQAAGWAAVGDRDRAFALLEQAWQMRMNSWLPLIRYHIYYEPLRGDPRYRDLLRRMNLEN